MYRRLENYKNELLISLMVTLVLFSLLFSMNYHDVSEFYFTRIDLSYGTSIIMRSYSDFIYYLLPITSIPSMIYLYVVLSRKAPKHRKRIKLTITALVLVVVISLFTLDLKTTTLSTVVDITALQTLVFLVINISSILLASFIALRVEHHKKIFLNFLLSQLVFLVGIFLIFNLITDIILMLYISVTIFQSIWVLCKFDEELLKQPQ